MANKMTRLDYCQYLLVTQINYTLTNFADHSTKFSHDQINRFLKGGRHKKSVASDGRLSSYTPVGKQLTGWEKCQCRKARIQRNHIGCALLIWVRLKRNRDRQ